MQVKNFPILDTKSSFLGIIGGPLFSHGNSSNQYGRLTNYLQNRPLAELCAMDNFREPELFGKLRRSTWNAFWGLIIQACTSLEWSLVQGNRSNLFFRGLEKVQNRLWSFITNEQPEVKNETKKIDLLHCVILSSLWWFSSIPVWTYGWSLQPWNTIRWNFRVSH